MDADGTVTGLEQIESKTTSIDKYMYLANLRNSNVDLFYRLLIDNMPVSFLRPLLNFYLFVWNLSRGFSIALGLLCGG